MCIVHIINSSFVRDHLFVWIISIENKNLFSFLIKIMVKPLSAFRDLQQSVIIQQQQQHIASYAIFLELI